MLAPRDRVTGLMLLVGMFFGATLETAGIGLVLPFLAVLGDSSIIGNKERFAFLHAFLNQHSPATVFIVMSTALLGFFLVKNIYLALITWAQFRFLRRQQFIVATKVLEGYLCQPYQFFLQRNSSALIRTVNHDVPVAFSHVLVPLATLIVETLVCTSTIILLLAIAPLPAIVAVFVLGGASLLYFRGTRRMLNQGALDAHHSGNAMARATDQALGGVKEAKIFGRERFFLEIFDREAVLNLKANYRAATIGSLPRLLIETLALAGIVLIGMFAVWQSGDVRSALPVLGLFAAAAVRLMPSATRILYSVGTIRSGLPAFDVVSSEAIGVGRIVPARFQSGSTAIDFRRDMRLCAISFSYSGSERRTLDDVSMTVVRGQSVAIVGPSGAGKTTLVDVILGLLPPSSGEIFIDDAPIKSVLASWQRSIGYVPQTVFLVDDNIRRNVAFGIPDGQISDALVWSALKSARLAEFVQAQPMGLESQVGENGARLSGGQRQRIGIARALYLNPAVLILDEATSSLDGPTENEIRETVQELACKKTILVVAHRLASVRQCDIVFFLNQGRVAASGTFDSLMSSNLGFREFAAHSLLREADEVLSRSV
jgi:ATP-binding cassette subfamily C protein